MLTDTGSKVRKEWGSISSFVLDKDGIVRHITTNITDPQKNIKRTLKTIKNIQRLSKIASFLIVPSFLLLT